MTENGRGWPFVGSAFILGHISNTGSFECLSVAFLL
jgi:hypothetical protein